MNQRKVLQNDASFVAKRLAAFYKKHGIKEVSSHKLTKDCKNIARLFGTHDRDVLAIMQDVFLKAHGSDTWDVMEK